MCYVLGLISWMLHVGPLSSLFIFLICSLAFWLEMTPLIFTFILFNKGVMFLLTMAAEPLLTLRELLHGAKTHLKLTEHPLIWPLSPHFIPIYHHGFVSCCVVIIIFSPRLLWHFYNSSPPDVKTPGTRDTVCRLCFKTSLMRREPFGSGPEP